ncbi:SHOCT domain-containing protein [Spongiactinospora sp. TRM90649]|uniref:SHOCT domain-containing protein n=1 Tax=Spongiactinospora sp. TRM90649 TaxID=3031114 RepID=UPI0023F900C5|nr:SHOCT domain-containing protein [Spongiactinospora sp. TRM90649]MDF5759141.1 SHOCT domain-containing protein [Spongiactinospora sp. TRM90649]
MPRSAKVITFIVLGIQVAWSLPLGIGFLTQWLLAEPEPDSLFPETPYMPLGLAFTGIGLVMTAVIVTLGVVWWRRAQRERHLREHGARATGVVTEVAPTGTRINGRLLFKISGEVPGMPQVRFQQRGFHTVPPGTRLAVAYDPASPGDAVVLDDIAALVRNVILYGNPPQPPQPSYRPHQPLVLRDAPPEPQDAGSGGEAVDIVDRIARLDELRRSGAISEDEYSRLKARLIES